MRFIVHEQRYEKRIGAGKFRYDLDGVPTGAIESWRLTSGPDGHTILRVDLDARTAESGHSYLYHLVRNADGCPQRLAYRFWGAGLEISGTLLFDEVAITGTRTVNGKVYGEDVDLPPGYLFWFPAVCGLGLLLRARQGQKIFAVTLNGEIGAERTLALTPVELDLSFNSAAVEEAEIAGRKIAAVPALVRWNDQQRRLLRDANDWPVMMERPAYDGGHILSAVETQYIWYTNR